MDELEYDLGRLLVNDPRPVDKEKLDQSRDEYLLERSTQNLQKLVNKIYQLPKENTNEGVYCQLPDPTTNLPREKMIPPPKKPSKWKEFVKMKGLKFQPKSFWQYDDVSDEFRPRVGPGSARRKKQDPIMDFQHGDDLKDPFGDSKRKAPKRKRDATGRPIAAEPMILPPMETLEPPQKKRKLDHFVERNRNTKKKERQKVLYLPTHKSKRLTHQARNVVNTSYDIARTSTASMGQFDKTLSGERAQFNSVDSKYAKVRPGMSRNRFVSDFQKDSGGGDNNNKQKKNKNRKNTQTGRRQKPTEILSRVLKEGERKKKQIRETSSLIWQKEFEKEKSKERKKSLIEQRKMTFKIRTKRRGGKGKKAKKNKSKQYIKT